ncbi:hypothetical protein RRK80_004705 [Salmonella enterica]|nr:hypothetical protein [Salmonella enterica]
MWHYKQRESVTEFLRKREEAKIQALEDVNTRYFNTVGITEGMISHQQEREARQRLSNFMRTSVTRLIKPIHGLQEIDLGYTAADLKSHLEMMFDDGMTWDNYGQWEIDHILSISSLLDMGETDAKIINALMNLQPLWSHDNRKKNKYWLDCDFTEKEFHQLLKDSL